MNSYTMSFAKFLAVASTAVVAGLSQAQAFDIRALPAPLTDADYLEEAVSPNGAKVELGRFLFFDPILSGNQNISCAHCHHPSFGMGDGLSLSVGEGGIGLGPERIVEADGSMLVVERVPRNAPHTFNLGLRQITHLFHDGRVSINADFPSGIKSPAGENLPNTLENIVAVQAMFPPTSATEMAGQAGENEVADAAARGQLHGEGGVWDLLASRLRGNSVYVEMFQAAFDDVQVAGDITFAHAANAIGAFEIAEFRADNSPFDKFLRGDFGAMSPEALSGMALFYGDAGCASCHEGADQTDGEFHAVGWPQIGPGKGHGEWEVEDFGRSQVSFDLNDKYAFRTPSLRNVTLTGPYGHNGAFTDLRDAVVHHLNVIGSLGSYDMNDATLPSAGRFESDMQVMDDEFLRAALVASSELRRPANLTEEQVDHLMAFLAALEDTDSANRFDIVPNWVPSDLPLQFESPVAEAEDLTTAVELILNRSASVDTNADDPLMLDGVRSVLGDLLQTASR